MEVESILGFVSDAGAASQEGGPGADSGGGSKAIAAMEGSATNCDGLRASELEPEMVRGDVDRAALGEGASADWGGGAADGVQEGHHRRGVCGGVSSFTGTTMEGVGECYSCFSNVPHYSVSTGH